MKRHPHETTVLGLFNTPEEAHQAMNALEPHGYDHGDISLVANKEAYEREELVKFVAEDKIHEESMHAGKVGGIAGAVLAGATALTAVLTGGASLLVAGPLVAVLTGAGGVLGSLLGTGFSEQEAQEMDHAIEQGGILVIVHAENSQLAKQAQETLKSKGASRIHLHH